MPYNINRRRKREVVHYEDCGIFTSPKRDFAGPIDFIKEWHARHYGGYYNADLPPSAFAKHLKIGFERFCIAQHIWWDGGPIWHLSWQNVNAARTVWVMDIDGEFDKAWDGECIAS